MIESLLILAFFTAGTIHHALQQRDICNIVSDVECTSTPAQDFLFILLLSSEIALVLTHAAAIMRIVHALSSKGREEPIRFLLSDSLLVVIGMPLIAAILCVGLKPVLPHAARTVNSIIEFSKDVRR